MKIFISGSISINQLPEAALLKLESIMSKRYEILIGDAKGADYNVQKVLAQNGYNNVLVYHVGNHARNNVYNWNTRQIPSSREKGRALFTLKDTAMARDADYALMIWDGKSKGTLNNMREMSKLNKKFLVVHNGSILQQSHVNRLLNAESAEQLSLSI